jgi:hypothetical protein
MSRFLELIDQIPPIPEKGPGHFDFDNRDRLFPSLIGASHFQLWSPGDPIPSQGTRILLGVATWSAYDLHLLDVVERALSAQNGEPLRIDVFNAGSLTRTDAFTAFIPEIKSPLQMPVVGIWRDGRLCQWGEGFAAADIVAKMFGSSADDIVKYVTQWREQRAAASTTSC